MRLANFIVANLEPILHEWETFARSFTSRATLDSLTLRDHADAILLATVRDMESVQSEPERSAKSHGMHQGGQEVALNGASEQHAIGRLGSGFDLLDLVSEYRALRASVLRLWHESGSRSKDYDVDDVTRFNESIDQSLSKAVSSYTKRVDQSRDLFLAILGHDLRNPLNSIAMSAALLPYLSQPAHEVLDVAHQIATNTAVMARMISDLLDYTRTRLGAGMPVTPVSMDLGLLSKELYNEFHSANPTRQLKLKLTGDLQGHWDADRLRQAISNLLGNAIQHSTDSAVVELSVSGDLPEIVLIVSNSGPPIPPGELAKIFDPLVRGSSADAPAKTRTGSIGLGLYIAQAIIRSHEGTITVTSCWEHGTAFTVHLPREAAPKVASTGH